MRKTLGRILRYSSVRILSILLTIGLGLYLTLLIINLPYNILVFVGLICG